MNNKYRHLRRKKSTRIKEYSKSQDAEGITYYPYREPVPEEVDKILKDFKKNLANKKKTELAVEG